jgi:hypothetical protein
MTTTKHIRCGAGESVFDALDRAITAGEFPARSYVGGVAKSCFGDSRPRPQGAIGTVAVRSYEEYWIMESSWEVAA